MSRISTIATLLLFTGLFLVVVTGSSETGPVTAAVSVSLQDQEGEGEQRADRTVSVMSVSGTIGPTTTNYLQRAHRLSVENGDEALIMRLNTPGGLLDSTQEIVQLMLGTDHPIVVYVSPEGANAGSAGTFITMAAHVAAMSPATNIGAASPVAMGGA